MRLHVANSSNITAPPTLAAPPTPATQASTETGQGMSLSVLIGMISHNMPSIVNPIPDAPSLLPSHVPISMNQGTENYLKKYFDTSNPFNSAIFML